MDRKKKKVATQASTQDGDAPLGVPCLRFTTVKELQPRIATLVEQNIFKNMILGNLFNTDYRHPMRK